MRRAAGVIGAVLLALGAIGAAHGAEDGRAGAATREEVFAFANAAFVEGASLRDERPVEARARLDEAIEGFRTLIEDEGISNPKLHYNLGNAYMLRDEVGRAIVEYRRAARLAPEDANVRANLAFARSKVRTSFEGDGASAMYSTLLGWQDAFPIRGRLAAFAALFALAWGAGLMRLSGAGRRVVPRWAMAALLAASLLPAASLGLTAQRQSRTFGVVVASSTPGLKGPDESYEPSFTRELASGVEFEVIEERPGWVYGQLPDGRTTWIERGAVELV